MHKIKSIGKYFFSLIELSFDRLKNLYFKTNFYNKKISSNIPNKYNYRPSQHIINCLIAFNRKKFRIDQLSLNSIWQTNSKNSDEFKNLHNFLWLLTLDIKTSKLVTQNIIENWIDNNKIFNEETWKIDILSKRIIAWISNTNLTLDESNKNYKVKFILSTVKQINHLFKIINNEKNYENKILGCSALILIGLVFKEYNKFYDAGLEVLKKTVKINFDTFGFPKSRNPQELFECLKYFTITREWIKESQNPIPEFLDEIIHSSGKSFTFINQNLTRLPLFNGSFEVNNEDFKKYLKNFGYSFKDTSKEKAGYIMLKDKKISFIMDIGNSVESKFSKKYQCGCLSFEITSGENKMVCNSGFYSKKENKLNLLSKSTAAHSTLYINDHSSCVLKKKSFKNTYETDIDTGLKIKSKTIKIDKDFDHIIASHNGYQKRYGYTHEREIKFIKKEKKFIGKDTLIGNGKHTNTDFKIRFHLYPGVKMVKTQNSHTILISLENGDGWKFNCLNYELLIEKGIFLGIKNKIIENENICIYGTTEKNNKSIEWNFEKIS